MENQLPQPSLSNSNSIAEDDVIRQLVDSAFKAAKQMIRTHHKEDIIAFIVLAQALEQHGYTMVWVKHKGVIGATKKSLFGPDCPTIIGCPKEVTDANQRANAVVDRSNCSS